MNSPHLIYRNDQTRKIIDTVQLALETERLKTNPKSFKHKQRDVVDMLVELGSKHKMIINLLKRWGLTIPE
jgi:hypothetical protein